MDHAQDRRGSGPPPPGKRACLLLPVPASGKACQRRPASSARPGAMSPVRRKAVARAESAVRQSWAWRTQHTGYAAVVSVAAKLWPVPVLLGRVGGAAVPGLACRVCCGGQRRRRRAARGVRGADFDSSGGGAGRGARRARTRRALCKARAPRFQPGACGRGDILQPGGMSGAWCRSATLPKPRSGQTGRQRARRRLGRAFRRLPMEAHGAVLQSAAGRSTVDQERLHLTAAAVTEPQFPSASLSR